MISTGYPEEKIHLIKGKVEDTLPTILPERLALLRLDTDWYESTKVCLKFLYPQVVSGGYVILDDYGTWAGCRKAFEEYTTEEKLGALVLVRIDHTGVYYVKP